MIKSFLKDKIHYLVSFLALGGIFFAAVSFSPPSSSANLDNFVLFAQDKLELEKEVQVSSGDLGSNNEIDVDKAAVISGNLFADKIDLDKNVQVNGNVSFNKLEAHKDAKILGAKTTPVSLPIANLPTIPDFQPGTQDFTFQGQDNTLPQGSYQNITLEKQSRLVLTGGVYNLAKLNLKTNSTLIYDTATVPETTVIDNFETEALGNLFGQNGWVFNPASAPSFTVQNTVFNQGQQAVKGQCSAPCPTNRVIGKALPTPITNTKDFTTLSFDLRVDSGLAVVPVTNAQFNTAFFAAFNANTGNIFLTARPKSVILAQGAPSAVWHHLDIHIDLENQRVQARVNQGPWSAFINFSQPFTGLNNIHLRVGSDLSPTQVNTTAYFDNLTLTIQKPSPTIVNIQKELKTQDHIAILPANNNLKPTDLVINYSGVKEAPITIGFKSEKTEPEIQDTQDTDENSRLNTKIQTLGEDNDKDDDCAPKPQDQGLFSRLKLFFLGKSDHEPKEKCVKPVKFGPNSFLNFKLLAPEAKVHIGENSTFRGQVLGRKVRVGKETILSREVTGTAKSDPAKIVTSQTGTQLIVNEILVLLTSEATTIDAQNIASSVNGQIVGFVASINLYQIRISSATITELDNKITQLKNSNNPKIKVITTNNLLEIL